MNLPIFWRGLFKATSIILIATIILICSFYDNAMAGDTRVVVGVSIGAGLVVGAFGIFLNVSYSSEVAVLEGKREGNLLIFPEISPALSNNFDQTANPDNKREEPLRVYFVGIRW